MSRTFAVVMGFALLGFCSAQNCAFLDGECQVSVKYLASLKPTNNAIDIFYTNISTVFAPCNNYNDAASCNAATKNYCSWNTSNSPSCNAPVTEAYAALAGIEVVGCLVGVKSTFCDFLTNTMNYCNMTTKDACNANANCIHSSGSCGPKPSRVYVIAGEVGKSLGSTHAASLASIANQCSTYNTSATCSAAKTNSAASVASGAGMLVIAVAAGLAALML